MKKIQTNPVSKEPIFWDQKGVLLINFMESGAAITSQVYCKILSKLCRAIQNGRWGMPRSGIVFFHDNPCPYVAARTTKTIQMEIL